MTASDISHLPSFISRPYKYIRLDWTPEFSMLRMSKRVRPIQCYSLALMSEMQQVFDAISSKPGLVRHFVMSSDIGGVFNFGGDLSLFVLLIRARDEPSLRLYARRCIDLLSWAENAAQIGIHTTTLVQGDTLGGGFESVLPFHHINFERSAQAGFPEVLFNLFPGMGAWNFMLRRAGFAVASDMILTGRIYGARELHRLGLVDRLIDDGTGEAALSHFIQTVHPRLLGILAAIRVRESILPITRDDLLNVVGAWTECALSLKDRDLLLMERLARAQARKVSGAAGGAIEEIKRLELETAWRHENARGTADETRVDDNPPVVLRVA